MTIETERLFSVGSSEYATARPQYPPRLFDYLSNLAPDLDCAWDCGTGSGQAAVALAERFNSVEATDVSPEQISEAAAHGRVRYSAQPAEATAFEDGTFSLVTVAQALHWFDFNRFWPEVKRVLKPGGIFAAWVYTWPHISEAADRIVAAELLDIIKPYWARENQLAWDGYANVPFPFSELAAPDLEMSLYWNLNQFMAYIGTWSATRRCVQEKGPGILANLAATLEREWGDPTLSREVMMEFHCRVTGRGDR